MGSTSKAEKQEKKRKQREDAIDDALVSEDEQPKSKKRKRDSEPAPDDQNAHGADDAKEKKKKDKKHKERDEAAPVEEEEQPVDKPKRKSKKRDSAAAATAEPPAPEDADDPVQSPPKKEKKKRKDKGDKNASSTKGHNSKYPNPAGDETLSDQAQKALAYAHSYAIQSDWKFNKARQNWLMKHIYDPAMVPDAYVRMVVHYLKSIKGQALEHMRKTCQAMVDPPTGEKTADDTAADGATTTDGAPEIQAARAAALLKKLPKSTSTPDAEDE